MQPIYVYPGSFCPPTYGHAHIVAKTAELFGQVIVVCSRDEDKDDNWFSMEDCVQMWKAYNLPAGATVMTLPQFKAMKYEPNRLVMVRGIRDDRDFDHEKKVLFYNRDKYGIDKYLYITSDPEFAGISSSRARECARELELMNLSKLVAPLVVTRLLKYALHLDDLFMVVGRPGAGKSTFLKKMLALDPRNAWINTDVINEELRPMIREHFGTDDLVRVAMEKETELADLVGKLWLKKLSERLAQVATGQRALVEVPYGLEPGKSIFRFLGGHVLYVGCRNKKMNLERVLQRGTPEHVPFIDRIPGWNDSRRIATQERLLLLKVESSGSPEGLEREAIRLNNWLERRDCNDGYLCSFVDWSPDCRLSLAEQGDGGA